MFQLAPVNYISEGQYVTLQISRQLKNTYLIIKLRKNS